MPKIARFLLVSTKEAATFLCWAISNFSLSGGGRRAHKCQPRRRRRQPSECPGRRRKNSFSASVHVCELTFFCFPLVLVAAAASDFFVRKIGGEQEEEEEEATDSLREIGNQGLITVQTELQRFLKNCFLWQKKRDNSEVTERCWCSGGSWSSSSGTGGPCPRPQARRARVPPVAVVTFLCSEWTLLVLSFHKELTAVIALYSGACLYCLSSLQ